MLSAFLFSKVSIGNLLHLVTPVDIVVVIHMHPLTHFFVPSSNKLRVLLVPIVADDQLDNFHAGAEIRQHLTHCPRVGWFRPVAVWLHVGIQRIQVGPVLCGGSHTVIIGLE